MDNSFSSLMTLPTSLLRHYTSLPIFYLPIHKTCVDIYFPFSY
jgi:hypothetical protein